MKLEYQFLKGLMESSTYCGRFCETFLENETTRIALFFFPTGTFRKRNKQYCDLFYRLSFEVYLCVCFFMFGNSGIKHN